MIIVEIVRKQAGQIGLPCIPDVGSSSASLRGSGATAVWQGTSRQLSPRQPLSFMPPRLCYSRSFGLIFESDSELQQTGLRFVAMSCWVSRR
jgi:hypothetical protein